MPFGAWKGVAIEEVPSNYLRWLLGTLEEGPGRHGQYPGLQHGIRTELAYRDKHDCHFEGDRT